MDEDLPIDIHYNKLLDWLLSRRHCSQNWSQVIVPVREKINSAIQDMPAVDDVANLLRGTYINYFHCVEIMRLLKLTEDNHRNIFGRYSSQRLKDWAEILKMYEKDDLYLAEAAQLLARNVNYEIPSVKKQIAKSIHSQQEYMRKEVEHARTAADLQESYTTTCRKMGIEGKKPRCEILNLVRDLPSTYDNIAQRIQTLDAAVQYYVEFVMFLLSQSGVGNACLPLLHFILKHGNVTVFEWRTGKQPSRVEAVELDFGSYSDEEDAAKDVDNGEIDWGDIGDSAEPAALPAVDVNIDSLNDAEVEGIDWSAVDDLSCGIEVEITGDAEHQPVHTDGLDAVDGDEVACGPDAATLLDNTDTRNKIVDELTELEAFLEQRVAELSADSSSDDVVATAIMQIAPASIHVDIPRLNVMLADVAGVRECLTSPHMRDLILIRSSPRYVDRLIANLRKRTSDADKMMSLSRLMSTRHSEAVDEQRQLEPQLDLLRQRTKELQKQIEGEISKRYKNRHINIMGEINTI